MSARQPGDTSKPPSREPVKRAAAKGKASTTLPESMVTGKASPVNAAVGDEPVFAYIASLPQPQRSIAECVDALAAKTGMIRNFWRWQAAACRDIKQR